MFSFLNPTIYLFRPVVDQLGIIGATVEIRVGLGVVVTGVKNLAVARADLEGEELTLGVALAQARAAGEGIARAGPEEVRDTDFIVQDTVLSAVDVVGFGGAPELFSGGLELFSRGAVVCCGCL